MRFFISDLYMNKRLKFFLGHLAVSIAIACLIIGLVFFIWYPSPLAQATGVTHIFLMLLAIDVTIGPILGFIVYKEGKKTLKFDLTVIILFQICAMCYGLYNISAGRPVWLVYNIDRFDLIRANDIEGNSNNWFGPQYKAIQISKDNEQRNKDLFNVVFGGVSLTQQPSRYINLDQVKSDIQRKAQDLNSLNKYNNLQQVQKVVQNCPQADSWVPLKANSQDMVVLMNKQKGEVVKIINLRPW